LKKWMNLLQNTAIGALVVLCIVQTIQLWYNGYSSRSFLSAFFSSDTDYSASDALAGLVRPYRIIAPHDDTYVVLYGDAERAALRAAGDRILTQAFRSGEYALSYALDEAALLASGGVWYEYAVAIPADAFGLFYQARTGFLTNRFRNFSRIVLIPQDADSARVVFVDDDARMCYEYSIRQSGLASGLTAAKESLPASTLHYNTVQVGGEDAPLQNIFYADWAEDSLPYQQIRTYGPFGEITITNIERIVLPFFETPGGVMWDVEPNGFTYRDDNAVAKYYSNDVLEFTDYKAHRGTVTNSFTSAFVAAANLLAKDKGIVNEYYLSSYMQEGDSWHLTFDYVCNGFPVFMSQSLSLSLTQNQPNTNVMTHMIEIEVRADKVYKYRRYLLGFEVDTTSTARKQTDFVQTVLNAHEGLSLTKDAPLPVQSVMLGYRADGMPLLSLHWLIVDADGMPLPSYD